MVEWTVERLLGRRRPGRPRLRDRRREQDRLRPGPGAAGGADGPPLLPSRRAARDRRRLGVAALGADRAERPLVRARRRRLQGKPGRAPDRPACARARAARDREDRRRGLRGAGNRRSRGVRSGEPRPAARRRDPRLRHGQRRGGRADPDDEPPRDRAGRGHRAHAREPRALGNVRRRRTRCARGARPHARHVAGRPGQHDGPRARRDPRSGRARRIRRSSSARTRACSTASTCSATRVADTLWARPTATVLGIDCPSVAGSSAAVPHEARARIDLRVPPGMDPKEAQTKLIEHLEAVAPWHVQLDFEREADGEPFSGSTVGPRLRGDGRRDARRLRPRRDALGPGRLDPALHGLPGDVPGRGDHAARRRGAAVPDPRRRTRASIRREIENIALAEVLFMQRVRRREGLVARDGGRRDARSVHGRGLRAADGARRRAGGGGGSDRHPRRARARSPLLHGVPADRDHRANHHARAAGRARRPR